MVGYLVVSSSAGLIEKCCKDRHIEEVFEGSGKAHSSRGEKSMAGYVGQQVPLEDINEPKKRSCDAIIAEIEQCSSSTVASSTVVSSSLSLPSYGCKRQATDPLVGHDATEVGHSLPQVEHADGVLTIDISSSEQEHTNLLFPRSAALVTAELRLRSVEDKAGPSERLQSLLAHSCSCCSS